MNVSVEGYVHTSKIVSMWCKAVVYGRVCSNDLVIEHVLMRSMETSGGLIRVHGTTK